MIKRLKKPCMLAVCDECGKDVFGYEFDSHFETREELDDVIDADNIAMRGRTKHFCSEVCETAWDNKHPKKIKSMYGAFK